MQDSKLTASSSDASKVHYKVIHDFLHNLTYSIRTFFELASKLVPPNKSALPSDTSSIMAFIDLIGSVE